MHIILTLQQNHLERCTKNKYRKILKDTSQVVMGAAFICIVIFSLMNSTSLSDLSFLNYIYFGSEILLIVGLIINSVPDFITKNIKNIAFDLILISFFYFIFHLGLITAIWDFEKQNYF